jgi:hypothetical protein
MTRSARVAVGICSILVAALGGAACSSNEHSSSVGVQDPNSNHTSNPSANAGTGNSNLDPGVVGNAGGSGGSGSTLPDACAAEISTAQSVPLDMYIMLDVSTSMLEPTAATTTKWPRSKLRSNHS